MQRDCLKIVRFDHRGNIRYGFLTDDGVEIATGELQSLQKTGETLPLDECKLLAPVAPQKIIIVARNYNSKEKTPKDKRAQPLAVLKPPTSIVGAGDDIIYPSAVSNKVFFEAEAAVIIGKTAKNVPQEKAADYILGFTLVNDVTDRTNIVDGQLFFAKAHDTFLPMGPAIVVTRDCSNVSIKGYLNGKLVQDGSWDHLVYSPLELIEMFSKFMTLLPGDVICMGTPDGASELRVGDTFTVQNEFIGELTNKVAKS
jgi:2-keto-4-pentenoate hydratase/2-oxohepta-3-ene-1,7-dioic acid hydratase in catechol pathway